MLKVKENVNSLIIIKIFAIIYPSLKQIKKGNFGFLATQSAKINTAGKTPILLFDTCQTT